MSCASSKLLVFVVTMQEVRNRAKFELGFSRCSLSLVVMCVQQIAWVCGHNAGGSESCKISIRICFGAHSAWFSCASSKLLGCAVTRQEGRNSAKFESGFISVIIQPGCHVRSSKLLGCAVTMQEVRNYFHLHRSTSDLYREQPRMNCNGV